MSAPLHAKGTVVRSTVDFVRAAAGEEGLMAVLARLDDATRSRLLAAEPTTELDYRDVQALWRSADAELAPRDPEWMERAGAHSIESLGVHLYGGILRKRSPSEFLTQSVSLFRLYYHPGNMEVVYEGTGEAVLRLVDFDAGTTLFCRRQTGGLRMAQEIAGGGDARARHVRCALEGDAFCEWELRWTAD